MSAGSDSTAGIPLVAVPPKTTLTLATANTKVFVALPWQKSTNPITAFCVAGLIDRSRTVACLNFGDAFVAHSRNKCVELFLASPCEWLLMLDDDMVIPFGNAKWFNAYCGTDFPEQFAGANAIDRLLSHKKTLVGGLYFGRHQHGAPMFGEGAATAQEAAFARKAPMDLIKPTRWVATGCMLIHRKVFEAIEKRFPRLARNAQGQRGNWFSSSEHSLMDDVDKCREVLSTGPMTGEKALKAYQILEEAASKARNKSSLGMGEDVAFCVRAAEVGHQPHVDFGLVCGHIGHAVYGPWNTRPR
jgi:hypothetical protein